MRFPGKSAVSLLMASAAIGLLAPAAMAAKKDDKKEAEATKLSASPEFFKAAKPLQDAIQAQNWPAAQAAFPAAEAAAVKPDDKYYFGRFLIAVGGGLNDRAMQRRGIEMVLATGKTPAEDVSRFQLAAGQLAMAANDMNAARAHFQALIDSGKADADVYVNMAESYFGEAGEKVQGNSLNDAGKVLAKQGLPYLQQAIKVKTDSGTPPAAAWYSRGLTFAVLADSPDQGEWAKMTLVNAGTKANWRLVLRTLQDANPTMSRDDDIDILRLMRVTQTLKDDYNYNEFAEALWRVGLPGEAKAVIDEGVKLGEIKQERFAELYKLASDAVPKDKASLAAGEAAAAKAPAGRPSASAASAYFSYGEYAKAAELYKAALAKGGVDSDQVNTRLGIALALAGDNEGAKAAFNAVGQAGLRRRLADLWIVYLDHKPTA